MTLYIDFLFFFNDAATTEIYTLSLHDALPISAIEKTVAGLLKGNQPKLAAFGLAEGGVALTSLQPGRSEEHTSELQSQFHLVCRLLLEKKKYPPRSYHRASRRSAYSSTTVSPV